MKAEQTYLLEFINKNDFFEIPIYQRNYAWRDQQIDELFKDIDNIVQNLFNTEHFLGTIVYIKEKSSRNNIVIDGQQRITTIMLLLKALHSHNHIKDNIKNKIEYEYLFKGTYENEQRYEKRLTLNEQDDKVYKNLLNSTITEEQHNSNIYSNYKKINESIKSFNLSPEEIFKALEKIIIVYIELENNKKENPQLIFESLNSKGLTLSPSDLIRNYLLMKEIDYDKQKELYKECWVGIEENLKTPENISEFIKSFLLMKNGEQPKKDEIYKEFQAYYGKCEANKNIDDNLCESILDDLMNYSLYYSYFIYCDSSDIKTHFSNPVINELLKEIKILKKSDIYALLIYVFEELEYNINELEKILNYLISYIVRINISDRTNGILTFVKKKCKNLNQEKNKNKNIYEVIFKDCVEEGDFPTNIELEKNFSVKQFSNKDINKYILTKINKYFDTNQNNIENVKVVNLMTVKPKKLTASWRDDLGIKTYEDIHKRYSNTISDLALIEDNIKFDNDSFLIVKNSLKKSNLDINKQFLKQDYDVWNEKSILKRSAEILNLILDIWRVPEGYYFDGDIDVKIKEIKSLKLNDIYDVTGMKPSIVIIEDEEINLKSGGWSSMFKEILEYIYNHFKKEFKDLVYEDKFQDIFTTIETSSHIHKLKDFDYYIKIPFGKNSANITLNNCLLFAEKFLLTDYIFYNLSY